MCAMAGRDTSTLNLELERLTASLKKEGMGTSSVPLSGELTCYPELGDQACIGRIAFTHSPDGNFVCTEAQADDLDAAWNATAHDDGTPDGFHTSLPPPGHALITPPKAQPARPCGRARRYG